MSSKTSSVHRSWTNAVLLHITFRNLPSSLLASFLPDIVKLAFDKPNDYGWDQNPLK